MATSTYSSYHSAEEATTNTLFTKGWADAVYIVATCSNGLTLTTTGGDIVFGNAVIGTVIPVRCSKAVYSAGDVVALYVS